MKKWLSTLLCLAMLVTIFPAGLVQAATTPAARLPHPVKSYVLYYGAVTQTQVDAMKKFDFAIVEPRSISDAQIKDLQSAGTIVVGYVPLTSIDQTQSPITGLAAGDYLMMNGQKVANNADNPPDWITDPRSTHYRQLVVNYTKGIYNRGFNGVFMDTVAEATDYSWRGGTAFQDSVLEGTRQLVQDIRNIDDSKILVQNGGWWEDAPYTVINKTAPYIDFLFWEDYDLHISTGWNSKLANVKSLMSQYGFGTLATTFANENDFASVDKFYTHARGNGFVPYAPWNLSGRHTYVNPNINTYAVPPRSTATTTTTPSTGTTTPGTTTGTTTPGTGTTTPTTPTTSGDTQAPTTPVITESRALSSSLVRMAFNSSDNVGVDHYKIYTMTSSGWQYYCDVKYPDFEDGGLKPDTVYTYAVAAVDAAGNESAKSATITIKTLSAGDTQAPTVPVVTSAKALTTDTVSMAFTSTDNVGVDHYKIYTLTSAGWQYYCDVKYPSFVDGGLKANTLYQYSVSAVDAAGNESGRSSTIAITTLAPGDTQAPGVPVITSSKAVSATTVSMAFTATDNVGIDHYKIYSYTSGGWRYYCDVKYPNFVDGGLKANTVYYYYVTAVDRAGNESGRSNTISIRTLTK